MGSYVIITKQEMDGCLNPFGGDYEVEGKEYVWVIKQPSAYIVIKIYTSIDVRDDVSRDVGNDAIRAVLLDSVSGKPFSKESKIYRVENWQGRLTSRIQALLKYVLSVRRCPKCNSGLVEREGKYGKFLGCLNYRECGKQGKSDKPKEKHIQRDNSLGNIDVKRKEPVKVSSEERGLEPITPAPARMKYSNYAGEYYVSEEYWVPAHKHGIYVGVMPDRLRRLKGVTVSDFSHDNLLAQVPTLLDREAYPEEVDWIGECNSYNKRVVIAIQKDGTPIAIQVKYKHLLESMGAVNWRCGDRRVLALGDNGNMVGAVAGVIITHDAPLMELLMNGCYKTTIAKDNKWHVFYASMFPLVNRFATSSYNELELLSDEFSLERLVSYHVNEMEKARLNMRIARKEERQADVDVARDTIAFHWDKLKELSSFSPTQFRLFKEELRALVGTPKPDHSDTCYEFDEETETLIISFALIVKDIEVVEPVPRKVVTELSVPLGRTEPEELVPVKSLDTFVSLGSTKGFLEKVESVMKQNESILEIEYLYDSSLEELERLAKRCKYSFELDEQRKLMICQKN